jgi:GTP-sensing pleiotropic transcriptional regulator CodY
MPRTKTKMSDPILMEVVMTEKVVPIVRDTRLSTDTAKMAMTAVTWIAPLGGSRSQQGQLVLTHLEGPFWDDDIGI